MAIPALPCGTAHFLLTSLLCQLFLLQRLGGALCPEGMDLLSQLLTLDPLRRPTAMKALAHPYFEPLRHHDIKLQTPSTEESSLPGAAGPYHNLTIA